MITEAKFKYALKEMMKDLPLEDINVTALCSKCNCHRQTFYYHYTDIYDLIAAILFNEDLSALEKANDEISIIKVLIDFITREFDFLRSTYNSAARDLIDDFIFGKLNARLFAFWNKKLTKELGKNSLRDLARRFSHFVSDEFIQCFKDVKLTPSRFDAKMNQFVIVATDTILPSMIDLCKKEAHR